MKVWKGESFADDRGFAGPTVAGLAGARAKYRVTHLIVAVPYTWLAGLATGAAVPFALATWRAGRRKRSGLCANCGYDLRGSTDRCPECGTPIPAVPSAEE